MAYVFDPINNTLIDDEDKSLGNKLAVLDSDLEKVLQELNERFGPGTIQEGTQGIPTPPKTIEREMFENAFKDSLADGGRVDFEDGGGVFGKEALKFLKDKLDDVPDFTQPSAKGTKRLYFSPEKIKFINEVLTPKLLKEVLQYQDNPFYRVNIKPLAEKFNVSPPDIIKSLYDNILPKHPKLSLQTKGGSGGGNVDLERYSKFTKYFMDNYKTKTVSQMARDLSVEMKGGFDNIHDSLRNIKKKAVNLKYIKETDMFKLGSGTKKLTPLYGDYKGMTDLKEYLKSLDPRLENMKLSTIDNLLKKNINFNKILKSIDPRLKPITPNAQEFFNSKKGIGIFPSYEHTQGIRPGITTEDPSALLKVRPSTVDINYKILGPRKKGGAWNLIKNFLEEARANLDLKNIPGVKESLNKVNEIYDSIAKDFKKKNPSYKRKTFPKYVFKNNKIQEVNVKDSFSKKETLFKSFRTFFDDAAATASDSDLKKMDKIQPSLSKVIRFIRKGDNKSANKLIRLRLPEIKGGQFFSFTGLIDPRLLIPEIDISPQLKNVFSKATPLLKGAAKATIVADPMFAALDFSKAVGEGVSGKQAAAYTAGSFFQDLLNLPRIVEDLAYTATEKGTFKNFGQKENRLFSYEPFVFADNYLDNVLKETPKEVLDARKAIKDFDTTIRSNMTMVDDIDIPASKAEIEAARNKFMDEKGVDLSVLDNLEEDKVKSPSTPSLLESLIAPVTVTPDKTFNQFLANGGRAGFSNGGAAGADDNFLKELEFYFTNEDAELPKLQTYKETKNPIEILNDIIDPRNYPYYADVLARSGLRIGEFAVRVLPATGKLISDLIQKPAFKITGSNKNNYVQDYMDPLPPSNIKGTGIFSEFLENITPTSLEKTIGLDKLIKAEEQKQIDRGSTVGPKVFADTLGLGAEVTAPIFPGLKLVRAYAKKKNLPVDTTTQKLLVKEIDKTLESRGMTRREFLQTTGAGATIVLAKMLGLGDDVAKTTKVAEKAAEKAAGGAPTYFFDLVDIIKKKGIDTTKQNALQDLQNVFSYKGYDLYEDLASGEIRIEKTNTGIASSGEDIVEGVKSQDVFEYKPAKQDADPESQTILRDPEEYNEGSIFPDSEGKMKEVESLDLEELLEFIKNEKLAIRIDKINKILKQKFGDKFDEVIEGLPREKLQEIVGPEINIEEIYSVLRK